MKIKDIIQIFRTDLNNLYPAEEIEAIIFHSLNEILGLSKGELAINGDRLLKVPDYEKLQKVVAQLKTNKPLQYILGATEFYGCKLRINEHVLIPRPETEELVDWIISESRVRNQEERILDIGCGSGCIAIALKKNIPDSIVSALDISDEALLIAKANSILNHAKINFLRADILNTAPSSGSQVNKFDIIVSNPPYVRMSEKENMNKNVVDHEPHLALFVNDDDPLLFYNTIADFSFHNLSKNGKLYFEINEALGDDVKSILIKKQFKNVEVKKDMSGKERMVRAENQ